MSEVEPNFRGKSILQPIWERVIQYFNHLRLMLFQKRLVRKWGIGIDIGKNGEINECEIKEMKIEIKNGKPKTTYIIGSRKTDDILTEIIENKAPSYLYWGLEPSFYSHQERVKTEVQGKLEEGIQLQNEILQEQTRQERIRQAIEPPTQMVFLEDYNSGDDVRDTIEAMTHAFEEFGVAWGKPKKYDLDKKYPHTCFSCGKKIYYNQALGNALPMMRGEKSRLEAGKQFKKWWKSDIVKFVCCNCHKHPEKIEQFIKKRERLLRQARNRAKKYKYEVEF